MDKQGKISSWQQQQQAYVAEAAKQIQFRKQQQKLRLMASAGQKPTEVSAESLIENILGKKETFQPVAGKPSTPNSNFQMAVDRPPHWLNPSSPLHPQLYREVWALVRSPQGLVETSKISPLLLTSGLSTNMLGYIWGLANCKIPGQLIENELYIILALVALAQNGITFNTINVLNMIPQPPIPKLIFPNKQQISPPFEAKNKIVNPVQIDYGLNSSSSSRNVPDTTESKFVFQNETFPSTSSSTSSTIDPMLDEFTEFQSANFESQPTNDSSKEVIEKFPSVMILGGRSIGSRLANHSLGAPKMKSKQQQQRPNNNINTSNQTQEFSDFHHHDLFPKCNIKPEQKTYLLKESAIRSNTYEESPAPVSPPQAQQSLMSVEEDKYSALRVLSMSDQPAPTSSTTTNNDTSADEFGDFFSADFSSNQDEFSFADIAKRETPPVQENPEKPPISFDVDEWSDFTSGDITQEIKPTPSQPLELFLIENVPQKTQSLTTQTANLTINDTKNETTQQQQQQQATLFFETDKHQLFSDEYSDFGEFVGPNEDTLDKDLFGNFQTSQKEDTQSVSSLELPPLALSRHGSVPSLELKVDANNWDSSSQANDQQINDWIRCLEISLQIFQFCITTFEGVSSEQVFSEVVSSNEGKLYFKNVLEIFKVCARIKKSFIQTSSESKQLENLISTIDSLWNNFKVFYIKAGLSEEYLELIERKSSLGNGSTCGICLLDTSTEMDIQIENKNKFYHVTCANLWANCINSNLPTPA